MPYTNGLIWGRPGGVLAKGSGAAPYDVTQVDITQAQLEADEDKLIRIPCHGVQYISLTSLLTNVTGGVGTTAAKYYYYGMNSIGELGTTLEQSADSVHQMMNLMYADLANVSSGVIAGVQRTYTDTAGVEFVTATGAGANAANGGEASALMKKIQVSQASTAVLNPIEEPLDVAGYFTDVIYLGGYFQEILCAFDSGSLAPTTKFNVYANRVYY